MDAKLTLKLNADVIEQAKVYAKNQNTSLSRLLENYLQSVLKKEEKKPEIQIPPLIQSFIGVIPPQTDAEAKEDYVQYLTEKYK